MASIVRKLGTLFQFRFQKIREINQKYAKPRITTGRGVTFALLILRLYLLFLILTIFYKFITIIH